MLVRSMISACLLIAVLGCDKGKPEAPKGQNGPSPRPEISSGGRTETKVPAPSKHEGPKTPVTVVKKTLDQVGLSKDALDRSVDPCTDFYRFACGGWIKKTKIPSDRARWMRSFSEIHKRNEAHLRAILDESRKDGQSDPAMQRLGRFYGSCMDEAQVERDDLAPIRPLLTAIEEIRDAASIRRVLATLHRHRIWAIFDISAEQDFKDARRVIGYLDQNGLGLPDRDYYLNASKKFAEIRKKYVAHVADTLVLLGRTREVALNQAAEIMHLETELAKISKTRTERRDPEGMYHKIDRVGVQKLTPSFDWSAYFKEIGHPSIVELNVTAPKFFAGVDTLVRQQKPAVWRAYLSWQLVQSMSYALSKRFVDQSFKLTKLLTGQATQRDRWKRCIQATDQSLGELLAQPFVKRYFGAASKKAVQTMIHTIAAVFGDVVRKLDWMDETTKARAIGKLEKMAYLIGYPAKWRRYDFPIGSSFGRNILAARAANFDFDLRQIGKPVGGGKGERTPPTVNAYYNPLKNHMVYPAGILQPPFYNATATLPVNMGGMGMVVGHELTHGFDDKGSKYDADGNLKNWWAKPVRARFESKTQCVDKQYSSYEGLKGVKLNGKLTLGENIADLGGVKLAYLAYKRLAAKQRVRVVADGFNEDQQFFLSVAQVWCSKVREAYARMKITVDPHSPPRFRVNGSLSNLPAFSKAFSCKPQAAMNPAPMCAVW
ncbi:MAG: M13 family metallopeptidase [Myxococcales bacterium]|nr:M13 family metallopeptidase [Myxococcales bacterium]